MRTQSGGSVHLCRGCLARGAGCRCYSCCRNNPTTPTTTWLVLLGRACAVAHLHTRASSARACVQVALAPSRGHSASWHARPRARSPSRPLPAT
eukprot:scaffold3713_cov372-Prasinococcus_capsulatus_cf.AAC.10